MGTRQRAGGVHVGRYAAQPYALLDEQGHGIAEANTFLDALALRGLSPFTLRAYAFDLLAFYRWSRGPGRPLAQLTAATLVDFVAEQRRTSAAPRSINRRLSTIRLLYRFHFGEPIAGNRISLPAPHYKGPGRDHDLGLHVLAKRSRLQLRVKEPRLLIEPLTVEQVRAFFAKLKRYRDLAIVHLMLLCGLRTCEVLRVELRDIDFHDHRLRIRGKGGRERAIPLPPSLEVALQQYLQVERPSRCTLPHVFVILQGRRRGSPMTAAGIRSLFRHRRQVALLASAHAHRFRHTFGTDMARAGVRLPVLQKMMGHADAKTTLQYIQLSMADVAAEYLRAITQLDARYGRK